MSEVDGAENGVRVRVKAGDDWLMSTLAVDSVWRIGRSPTCDVVLGFKRNGDVSAIALALRLTGPPGRRTLRVFNMQRGSARLHVQNSVTGDEAWIGRDSLPPVLKPGDHHDIVLYVPRRVLEIDVTPPAHTLRIDPRGRSDRDTQTWSVGGVAPHAYAWMDVAAVAVTLDRFPDLLPVLANGRRASPSASLQLAMQILRGSASNSYCQNRLREALDDANLSVQPGQDRQTRVALFYSRIFDENKIERVADLLRDNLDALAMGESAP